MTIQLSWTNTVYMALKTSKSSVPVEEMREAITPLGKNVMHNRVPGSEEQTMVRNVVSPC